MEILNKKYILSVHDEDTFFEVVAGNAGKKTVGILQIIAAGDIMAFILKDESDVNILIEKLHVLKHEIKTHSIDN
jgi:hypothetical protein